MRLTRSVNRDDILPFQKGELEGKKSKTGEQRGGGDFPNIPV